MFLWSANITFDFQTESMIFGVFLSWQWLNSLDSCFQNTILTFLSKWRWRDHFDWTLIVFALTVKLWCMNCKSITIRLHFSLIIKRLKGIHLKISDPNRMRHVNKRLLYRVSLSISVGFFVHKPCFTWFLVAGTMERLGLPIMSQ